MKAEDFKQALQAHASVDDAVFLQRFFKTGEGQYGQGDVFIGVRVPQTRQVCKQFKDLPLPEIEKLLASEVHEHRLGAVLLLADRFAKARPDEQEKIYHLYLKNVHNGRINNWDIIDTSAEFIIGPYLSNEPRDVLFTLASGHIWERRVAMLSAFHYIKIGQAETTLQLAEVLLHDPEDLIQKATGWMLREVGKRIDEQLLVEFLEKHYKTMPRTMLRYAIERLPAEQKAHFMDTSWKK